MATQQTPAGPGSGAGSVDDEPASINIGNINGGAAIEQFDRGLALVLANICDLSTVATAARVVTLQVVFKPHADRIKVETEVKISTKLASPETHKSQVFLARAEGGEIVALDADPRQMPLWAAPKPLMVSAIEFTNKGAK